MKEIWKDYVYNYQISNLGRIRNKLTNKILKQNIVGNGYLAVVVSMGKKGYYKSIKIHRAVASLFIPNPNNLPQVNHIDGNKLNNCVDNLEWCDNRYNTIHALNLGLRREPKGEDRTNHKLSMKEVEFIRDNYKPKDKHYGCRALARRFGVHHETIRQVLINETWNK